MAAAHQFARLLATEMVDHTSELTGQWVAERLSADPSGETVSTNLVGCMPSLIQAVAQALESGRHGAALDVELEPCEPDELFAELSSLDHFLLRLVRRAALRHGADTDEVLQAVERCLCALAGLRRDLLDALVPGEGTAPVDPVLALAFCRSLMELRRRAEEVGDLFFGGAPTAVSLAS